MFAMLERNGRHLPPDLRAPHRNYIHRCSVTAELIRFGNEPQYVASDDAGDFYNAEAVRMCACMVVRVVLV